MSAVLRSSTRCIGRVLMPYWQVENAKCPVHSSVQPLVTWTERIKRWSSGNQTGKKTTEDQTPEAEPEGNGEAKQENNELCAEGEAKDEIEETLKEKEEKIKDLQDKYLRALAETENIRQRMTKQIEESKLYGVQQFSKDILSVADILQKATESVPKDALEDKKNHHLIALYDGVRMTEAELQKVLARNGITKIDPLGQLFDPAYHEAMFEVEGAKPGTIAHVSALGYALHGRTIRPAKVGVVKS